MPMIWNTEADAKLLCAIIQLPSVNISGQDKEAIAKIMGCTAKALTHRLAHFRALAKASSASALTEADGEGDTETTPAKTKGRKKQTPKKRKAADVEAEGDEVEQTEEASKKVKTEEDFERNGAGAFD